MTEPTPEAHPFQEDPNEPNVCAVCGVTQADHPVLEPEPPACDHPGELIYTTERRALAAVVNPRRYTVAPCPAGHWHVVPKRSGDGVPNPDPVPAEAEITNTEER